MRLRHASLSNHPDTEYAEINIDHGTFAAIVPSCSGGIGIEALKFYNRLGHQVAEKGDEPVSSTINLIRTELSFSPIKSALLCIRESRSHKVKTEAFRDLDVSLAVAQSHFLQIS